MRLADNLALHGQVVLTEASSSFSDLYLREDSLVGKPPGFNYTDITELQDFSNLRIRQLYFEAGVSHLISGRYNLEYNVSYNDLNDYQPYIVNATGSRFGTFFRFNWLF